MIEVLPQRRRLDCIGCRRKDLNRIEFQLRCHLACRGKIVPEDEWTTASFGHKANRNSAADHGITTPTIRCFSECIVSFDSSYNSTMALMTPVSGLMSVGN